MQVLIKNIGSLVNVREKNVLLRGKDLARLPCIKNAYLVIEDGLIKDYGKMTDDRWQATEGQLLPKVNAQLSTVVDANNAYILPCWCDSHTHLVFAASREDEFVDKIKD